MNRIYLHPLGLRIWHWLNAVVVVLLILTGIQLRTPDAAIFPHYGLAVALHKWTGFGAGALLLFWIACYAVGGGFRRHYLLTLKDLSAMPSQARFYLVGIFLGEPNPFSASKQSKFNPLQKIAYSFMMLICMPVIVITGILFSDILFFLSPIRFIGGVRVLDAIHVIAAYFFVLYLIVHLYMATLGHRWYSHIWAMATGWEGEGEKPEVGKRSPGETARGKDSNESRQDKLPKTKAKE
jgi:thiosulfate reductase cytochrome b subunit